VEISRPNKQKTIRDLDNILRESNENPIVTTFLSDWLGASQLLESFMSDLKEEYEEDPIRFYQIPADHHTEKLYRKFGIDGLPATVIFEDGKVSDHFKGILSKNKIRERIDEHLPLT
jgi:thioredoxin 1